MNSKLSILIAALAVAGVQVDAQAQVSTGQQLLNSVQENFSGATTSQQWYWFNAACLTAGTAATTASPGTGASCTKQPYYSGTQVGGNSGNLNNQPDSGDQTSPYFPGALRLTNDAGNQSGAIISSFAFPLATYGLSVTFTTETYEGDSGGNNKDGADGISFFLQDTSVGAAVAAAVPSLATNPTLGDFGGSLGYTCSNTNASASQGYDGMVGGYLAVGIDEFGNFWNPGDNTSTGPGYVPNRVALRGGGSTTWNFLNNLTPLAVVNAVQANPYFPYNIPTSSFYPSNLSASFKLQAVRQTCTTGYIWDYSKVAAGTASSPVQTNLKVPNYAIIPGAYRILPQNIAIENANLRGYGTTVTPNKGSNIYGIPITYNLTITTAGLLSLSYSYNGGAYQPIITQQQIASSNYPIPQSVRFGFAGSTGGSRNIHEIMCFQAIPQNSSQTSAGLNQKQTAKVQTGTQVYFAFYNANNWTGSLTSQYLDTPAGDSNANDLQIDPSVNWDASCALTGVPTGQTCAKTGAAGPLLPQPVNRNLMTWVGNSTGNGGSGAPLQWASLSSTQQQLLDAEDTAYGSGLTAWRLNYLRGSRVDEQNASGVDPNNSNPPSPGGLRARTSVLGDIIDSSPTWVGPPSSGYPNTWADLISADVPYDSMIENSTTHTYGNFANPGTTANNNEQQRLNVVYTGANDGFMHGFETGSFNSDGSYNKTNNDGVEVIGYMPSYVVSSIDDAFTTTTTTTGTGTSAVTTTTYSVNPASDFSDPQYGHKFSVDAPPGTGDLFYNNAWHTWLVGGMGPGGKAIYALDITDPSQFSESNASGIVIGEWSNQTRTIPTTQTTTTTTGTGTSAVTTTTTTITGLTSTSPNTLTCVTDTGTTTCASNLGNTYGVPQIRRFHNGSWGAVFGNGLGSTSGDAGIFLMLVTPNSGSVPTITFRYLSTGWAASGGGTNGIAYTTPADLDGDHITDYVYAGDLQGNVWRFDLTSYDPTKWAVTPNPIFTTAGGPYQPITTKLAVASVAASPFPRVLIEFGTGQQTAFSNSQAAKYAPFTTANIPASTQVQALYGIWDSNMSGWNAMSSTKYAYQSSVPTLSGTQYLQQQSILNGYSTTSPGSACGETSSAGNSSNSTSCVEYYRTVSSLPVCWADATSACNNPQYGWYLNLDTGYANPTDANDLSGKFLYNPIVDEQVIFNPTLQDGAFIVNTTIPPTNSLRACASTPAGGWTMAINPATGGAFTSSFFGDANHNFQNIGSQIVSGIALNGTGSASVVLNGTATYLVTQTVNGQGAITAINPPGGSQGSRLTWIEKR